MSDKPNFALLIGKPVKKPGMSEDDDDRMAEDLGKPTGEEAKQDDMLHSATADFMAALKASNVPAATAALRDFIELSQGQSEEPEEPSESEEE